MWQTVASMLITLLFHGPAAGLILRNEQLWKCVGVKRDQSQAAVMLRDCQPGYAHQEWEWHPESGSLSSMLNGECLSAPGGQEHEAVQLHICQDRSEGQMWSCSKKGHLTLRGTGLHLSARPDSHRIFLSRDRGRASKWRTLDNDTVCSNAGSGDSKQHRPQQPHLTTIQTHTTFPTHLNLTAEGDVLVTVQPWENVNPEQPTLTSFTTDYGVGWQVAMVVLSSLALLLGLVILVLNIYHNRGKKVVLLKPCTRTTASPVPHDRTPLTKSPVAPHRSPSLQRGEILIEWKDGTVTPLFDSGLCSTN
ncbi:uncharacterized protein LOC114799814 [Denticeps clupeoides]|uniref:Ricin B lectin domain-containing protein n=1 Tax=Denticeps clupeoides TaxID=299321 RepID=A0AAY4C135_9TELE|nr:uncharacterized protein LOC114799814 [Denticeps clupeoides]XP_028852524.1 uncharacterized protein LOC114799814 [Denticeps clupeoides]